MWYDQELRYVRFDYRVKNQVAPLYTLNPITEIHDYRFGKFKHICCLYFIIQITRDHQTKEGLK